MFSSLIIKFISVIFMRWICPFLVSKIYGFWYQCYTCVIIWRFFFFAWNSLNSIRIAYFFFYPHARICVLILEREERRGRRGERNIDRLPPAHTPTGDKPATFLVYRTMLQPTQPPNQGMEVLILFIQRSGPDTLFPSLFFHNHGKS